MGKDKETKVKTKVNKEKSKKAEKKNVIKVKNNYFLGIIGAIIGGLIASIPWILLYVYGNLMLSALSIVISAGVFYGYKLFEGKMTKALPTIEVIISILITIITMIVLIPIFLMQSEGTAINVDNIKDLYENVKFLELISSDSIIAIIFSIFGAFIIASKIKKTMASDNVDSNDFKELDNKKEELKNKIKSKVITIIIGLIFIFTMVGVVIYNQIKIRSPQEVTDGVIKFQIDAGWKQGESEYENEWAYYKYINNIPPKEDVKEGDYSKYPAYIDVMYFKNDIETVPNIESVKKLAKESILSREII